MAKKKHTLTNWQECYRAQEPLTSAQIEPGGTYRTLKFIKGKKPGEEGSLEYGIVTLKNDSTTEVLYSYNMAAPNQWAEGGQINPDRHKVYFFPARAEHYDAVKMAIQKETLQMKLISLDNRYRALLAELDHYHNLYLNTLRPLRWYAQIREKLHNLRFAYFFGLFHKRNL